MLHHVLLKSQTAEMQETLFKALCIKTVTERLLTDEVYMFSFSIQMEEDKTTQKQFAFSWVDSTHDTIFFCLSDITTQYETADRKSVV